MDSLKERLEGDGSRKRAGEYGGESRQEKEIYLTSIYRKETGYRRIGGFPVSHKMSQGRVINCAGCKPRVDWRVDVLCNGGDV